MDKALMKGAQQVKCQFLKVSSTAQGLIERVRSGSSDWAWANNDEHIGKLETLLSEASTQMSCFGKDMLVVDMKVLREKLSESEITKGLNQFVELRSRTAAISNQQKMLLSMHSRRMQG